METYIISAFWTFLETICFLLIIGAFLPQKKNKYAVIFITAAIIITSIHTNLEIHKLIQLCASFTIYTVLSKLLYTGKWLAHIFIVVFSYAFIAAIDIIIVYGTGALLGIGYFELIMRKFFYVTVVSIGKLLAVLFAWILHRSRSTDGLQKAQSKWFLLSLLFPATSVVMLFVLFLSSKQNKDLALDTVIFSVILAAANFAMLYIISAIEKSTKHEQEAVFLKQQITLQSENYAALERSYRLQRRSTHEFERHIQALGNLLEQGEYSAAKNYVGQLQRNRMTRIFSIVSNNPVIDIILNQKYQTAQELNIKMRVQINDLSQISIKTDDLVVLLSNLLDNAIEACQRIDSQREIHCSILYDEEVFISVRNTSPPVEIMDNSIVTSKTDGIEHGYGLPAIKYILNGLDAEYTFDYSGGWFQFAAEIPI